jgi:hypothetical protein
LGFQLTAFAWRVQRELNLRTPVKWVPPADLLNLVSLGVIVVGVFALPTLRLPANDTFARDAFVLGLLLFAGYPFALAGHYRLFRTGPPKPGDEIRPTGWCSASEAFVVSLCALAAAIFICVAALH